ncbi:MAG: ribonuclease P protein component [Planctomycetota bacterium]
MTQDQRFRRRERLRSRSDFARVYGARQRQGDGKLVVYVIENGLEWSRLGLSVSRRVGGAVCRNYIRRRIREAFRTAKSELPTGLDIICVATPGVTDAEYDLARAFRNLVVKAAQKRP